MKIGFTFGMATTFVLLAACSSASPDAGGDASASESTGASPVSSFTSGGDASNSGSEPTEDPSGVSNSGDTGATDPVTTTPLTTGMESGTTGNITNTSLETGTGSLSDSESASQSEPSSVSDSDSTTVEDTSTSGSSTTSPDDTSTGPDDTSTGMPPDPCEPVLHATIRDFAFSHPDFEDYGGNAAYKGIVQNDLGPDKKPVYAHPGPTPQTTGPNEFKQWYNDTPNVNQTFMVDLPLMEVMPGIFQFADNTFFPIDNQGFGNEGQANNFAFTTEIHTTFVYNGGETFTFTGDDDVWIFINNKLAIDLGGLHPQLSDSVNLDAAAATLGITPGNFYDMDIFHAERHTSESNFRIDTTIGCFTPQ